MAKAKKVKNLVQAKKLTMADIIGNEFQMAVLNLMNSTSLPVKASYTMLKVFREISAHQRDYEEFRTKLLDKYCEKSEDGTLKVTENKAQYVLSDKASFDREYSQLLAIPVETAKIPLSYIEEAKLSPAQLGILLETIVNTEA